MAFSLNSILSSLRKTSTPFDIGTGEFNHIDVDSVKEILKLEERAAENGKNNVPSLGSSQKDAMASEIDAYINQLVEIAKSRFTVRLKAQDDLSDAQSGASLQEFTEIYESARNDLMTTAKNYYNRLFSFKKDWMLATNYISKFQEAYNLNRPARYPSDRTLHLGWIFAILVAEVIINALTLGNAHPDGMGGVAAEIFLFGLVNVIVAFFLGCFFWKWLVHKNKLLVFFGCITVCLAVAFLVFWNLLLAHYRDALKSMSVNFVKFEEIDNLIVTLGGKAFESVFASTIFMDDFKSYLLLAAGLVAAIVATYKSYTFDDPCPGYGSLDRDEKSLAKKLGTLQNQAFLEMDSLIDDYTSQINGRLVMLKNSEKSVIDREREKQLVVERYNSWLVSAQSVGEALYAHYREENMKARKSKKTPKCFNTTKFQLSFESKAKLPRAKKRSSSYGRVEKQCAKYLSELNTKYEEYKQQFYDLEKMSPSRHMTADLDESSAFRD